MHVLVDHHHEPVTWPDLQGIRDQQPGPRVFLPELAELLTERGRRDLLGVVAVGGLAGALRELHPRPGDRDQQGVADLRPEMGVYLVMEATGFTHLTVLLR